MPFRMNLAKAEKKVLSEGWYKGLIEDPVFRTREGEDPLLDVQVLTQDNDNDAVNGVRLYRTQALGDKSLWAVKEMLEAAFGPLEGDSEGEFEFEPDELSGKPVWVFVTIDDEYDGTPRNRIDYWAHIEAELDENGDPVRSLSSVSFVGEGADELKEQYAEASA